MIFGVTLTIWGYARYRQCYRKRFAALALGAIFYAICCDWAAIVFGAAWLGALLVVVILLGHWSAPADRRRVAVLWAAASALCALAIGAHLYVFAQLGQLTSCSRKGTCVPRFGAAAVPGAGGAPILDRRVLHWARHHAR